MRTREKIGVGVAMSMGVLWVSLPAYYPHTTLLTRFQSRRMRHHQGSLHNPTPPSRLLLQRQRRNHLDRGRNSRRHHRRQHPRAPRLLPR